MPHRRTGAQYEVAGGPTMTKSFAPEMGSRPRHTDKNNEFSDLRVDMHDRMTKSSAAKSILGVTKAPLVPSRSTKGIMTTATNQSSIAFLMPSATPNGLKRCQSASTIRRKLQQAMDQSAHSYHDHGAQQSLSTTGITKPTPKSLLLNHRTTSCSSMADTASNIGGYDAAHIGKPNFANMFAESASDCYKSVKRPPSAGKGAFKSNTIELEVELAERLNEIERSKLNEKAESRFRASQRAFDQVIQQDEAFRRILMSIRDEYDAYIAFITHNPRASTAPACQCDRPSQSSNQSRELGLDVARVRQENSVLKKSCSTMQREIDVLQASILAAAVQRGKTKGFELKAPLQPEDDSVIDDDELSDVLLLPLIDAMEHASRPSNIPQLDFSSLSPYSEDEDEDFEEADEQF